jgi:hypothetical protein
MSADDRNDSRDEQQSDTSLPVEDLQPKPVDEQAADAVKGGATEFVVSKPSDAASVKL